MKKLLASALGAALLSGCAGLPPELQSVLGHAGAPGTGLAESEIAAGLREALTAGTERAVARIGVPDGFWRNRDLQIPLPDSLKKVEKTLRTLGQGRTVDEFHLSLNRAAEAAVPEAVSIFATAIRGMTLADARGILDGPPNAATEYFRGRTTAQLTARFRPIVSHATSTVGATRKYKDLVARVGRFVPDLKTTDLDGYVTERALHGAFRTLAEEEARIRADPAARTSEILRRVFGTH